MMNRISAPLRIALFGPSTTRRALLALGVVAVGCGVPGAVDDFGTPGVPATAAGVEVVRSALAVDGLTEAQYLSTCTTNGVPAPPQWGKGNIDRWTAGGQWHYTGHFADSFVATTFNGDVYYSTSASGICVVVNHDVSPIDVICQGTNGKACFWEGKQPVDPPAGKVTLVPSGAWGSPPTWIPIASPEASLVGNPQLSAITPCTTCHSGQNVFINHATPGHPLNIAAAQAGWMTSNWMNPLVRAAWPQNPVPDPNAFNGYPTSNCLGCHSSPVGGTFPVLGQGPAGGNFCSILSEVTNRPAASGGMPPTWPDGTQNWCTPGVDCARQIDPFVKQTLKVGCGISPWPDDPIARATSGSPSVVYGQSSSGSYKGDWEHIMADGWSGTTHQTLVFDNLWDPISNAFRGWSGPTSYSTLTTPYQTSFWIKDANMDGSKIAMMATRYDQGITDRSSGTFNNINRELAAGAPSAYVRHDNQMVAVYRGYDNNIHQIVWSGSSWGQDTSLPTPTGTYAIGDPIGYVRSLGSGGSSSVLWVCWDGGSTTAICEDRLVNGQWWPRSFGTAVKIKDDGAGDMFLPRPNTATWGTHAIAYAGTDGLHVISDPSEPWYGTPSDARINTDTTIASAPAPYNDQRGYLSVVYRAQSGSTSSIVEMQGGSSGYTQNTLFSTTSETLTDDPAVFVAVAPWENTIFFRSVAHRIYQLQWSYASNRYVKSTVY